MRRLITKQSISTAIAAVLVGCNNPVLAEEPSLPKPAEAKAEKLDPALEQRIQQLISQLGHENWNVRHAASKALLDMGRPAIPLLNEASDSSPQPLVRAGAKQVLKDMPNAVTKKKLQSIEIQEVNFKNADLAAVVDFLSEETIKLDPEKVGINFVLKDAPPGRMLRTLRLHNVKLDGLLKIVTKLTDMEYYVENGIVIISPKQE